MQVSFITRICPKVQKSNIKIIAPIEKKYELPSALADGLKRVKIDKA